MSQAIISDQTWAEMTDAQKIDAVLKGHATLNQMSEGLLDGSEELKRICQESLAHTTSAFENVPLDQDRVAAPEKPIKSRAKTRRRVRKAKKRNTTPGPQQRFGLPAGFAPSWQRYERSVLLELNIYQLPSGQEFIPFPPVGTLGSRQHLYALLTIEQYLNDKRGSVYVRTDGRIFDYSVDLATSSGDFFDTGYTMYDLERTGRYAPAKHKKRKKVQPPKVRHAGIGR